MPAPTRNLYTDLTACSAERIDVLQQTVHTRIERIVSWGQASPPGFWYDQDQGEWVALLTGAATLRLAEPEETVDLKPGDWLWIAAHRRHRVEATAKDAATVWLAVFTDDATPP